MLADIFIGILTLIGVVIGAAVVSVSRWLIWKLRKK